MVVTYAPTAHKLLQGVFAVYKPSGVAISSLLREVQGRLVQDINTLEQRPQKQMILFKPASETHLTKGSLLDCDTSEPSNDKLHHMVPTYVPDWFDHPLVQGPRYNNDSFHISAGHTLDVHACGLQVLGLQEQGEEILQKMKKLNLPRRYQVKGQFGLASLTFGGESRIVEKSTWDHITEEKITRVLTVLQGKHRNACMEASGLDLSSQQAYRLASKGFLRPYVPTDSVIIDMKLTSLKLPEFILDITCIRESCIFIRKIIHQIGLELRSNAICTQLQRQQDAVFTIHDELTLLGKNVNVNNVIDSINHTNNILRKSVLKRKRYFAKTSVKMLQQNKSDILFPEPSKNSTSETVNKAFDHLASS
ncbi:pseudouridylate synthase TRUB2, mitochondrial-like [Clavelina lepadiformis]|uniref:pseudouridylate synthase TRUB2, mitochondrial-like n=1 Tax=Clavelina lepadiformis TaxID=159417 RepID=UPI00404214B9